MIFTYKVLLEITGTISPKTNFHIRKKCQTKLTFFLTVRTIRFSIILWKLQEIKIFTMRIKLMAITKKVTKKTKIREKVASIKGGKNIKDVVFTTHLIIKRWTWVNWHKTLPWGKEAELSVKVITHFRWKGNN